MEALTIQHIVSSGDLKTDLNINAIAIGLGLEHVEYEPEQFPGLFYRVVEADVFLLLFGSGEAVTTGGKEPTDTEHALPNFRDELVMLGLLAS